MAFADPQTVTISAVPIPLPRVFAEGSEAAYQSSDGLVKVSFNHNLVKQGRVRHLARIDHSKLTSDPYKPTENVRVNTAIYVVVDQPPAGYTATEILAVWAGFNTLLTASSNAAFAKVLGGES